MGDLGSNGTENDVKVFSFVDRSDSSRVKSDRGHHHTGVAQEGGARAPIDRAVKDRKHPLYRCSGRTYLGNRLSPSSWPIDSQNRGRDRTELESNPPTSQHAKNFISAVQKTVRHLEPSPTSAFLAKDN